MSEDSSSSYDPTREQLYQSAALLAEIAGFIDESMIDAGFVPHDNGWAGKLRDLESFLHTHYDECDDDDEMIDDEEEEVDSMIDTDCDDEE